MERWFLLYYQARWHIKVRQSIERIGVEVFNPMLTVMMPRADKVTAMRKREEPLFPSYMFLRFDPDLIHTSKITLLPGASHFVSFTGEPCVIPESVIATLLESQNSFTPIEIRESPRKKLVKDFQQALCELRIKQAENRDGDSADWVKAIMKILNEELQSN